MAEAAGVIVGKDDTSPQYLAEPEAPASARGRVMRLRPRLKSRVPWRRDDDYGRVAVMMLLITEGP
jgi:hypothetical protein